MASTVLGCACVCVTVTAWDEYYNPAALKGGIQGFLQKVRFILSSHTLNIANDLLHDNCANKPFWPCMPVSVRARLDEANLNIGSHHTVCLQRIAAPCQSELRGMWTGLTVHAHVHTLKWMCTKWVSYSKSYSPPLPFHLTSASPCGHRVLGESEPRWGGSQH